MCRIVGLITDMAPEDAKARLSSMIGTMLHDRFDTYGTCCLPELGCYLGWVTEGALKDSNPVVNRQGDQILVFAGEHFTETTQGDASSLLSVLSMDEKGDRRLRDLNGWFAGALVDVKTKTVLLFNDRFALHRIYYTRTRDVVAFASEAKALLAIRPETRKLSPAALGEFVAFGSVLNDRTLFEDIFLLPAGSSWTITGAGAIEKRRYFAPEEWERQPCLSEDEFHDRLESTMSRVVRRYMGGPQRVGVSLTGGVDSRLIMAFAEQAGRGVPTYTFGGMHRDCYDVRIAREVARACGCSHEVLRLGPEFLRNFGECAEKTVWVTDGTLDLGATHEVYLNGLARKIAPVRITGNYGSEILRGATTFKPSSISTGLFNPDFVPHIQEAQRSLAAVRSGHQVSFSAFQEIPWHLQSRLSSAQSQLTVRSPYTDNELVALAYQAPPRVRQTSGLWNRLISEQHASLASIPTDRGHIGNVPSIRTLPNRIYNQLLFKSEWYYEAGMPHWLARMDRRVPQQWRPLPFVGSHKIEHYRTWFRDDVFEYLQFVLCDSHATETPYVNAGHAREILAAHREGRGNYVTDINRLATIALIQKLFISEPQAYARRGQPIQIDEVAPGRTPRQITTAASR